MSTILYLPLDESLSASEESLVGTGSGPGTRTFEQYVANAPLTPTFDSQSAFPFNQPTHLTMSTSSTSSTLIPSPGDFMCVNQSPYPSGCHLSKRESYKDRRKTYQIAKKKVAEELLSTISDPTVVVLADWLKVRGTLKGWTKIWCELKPGLIVLYKSPKTHKSGIWVGTVLLSVCEVIERPSKKDGFCFKLFHPLGETIWASRGPKGESFGAIMLLPVPYLIFRAPSEAAGKQWMEAIELSFRASTLLVRNAVAGGLSSGPGCFAGGPRDTLQFILNRASQEPEDVDGSPPPSATLKLNESEIEKHFGEIHFGYFFE